MKTSILIVLSLSFVSTEIFGAQAPGMKEYDDLMAGMREFGNDSNGHDVTLVSIAREMIEKNKNLINKKDSQGSPLLMNAVGFFRFGLAKYLIDQGADIFATDAQNNDFETVLMSSGTLGRGQRTVKDAIMKKVARKKKDVQMAQRMDEAQKETEYARRALVRHIAEEGRGPDYLGEARPLSGIIEGYLMPEEEKE